MSARTPMRCGMVRSKRQHWRVWVDPSAPISAVVVGYFGKWAPGRTWRSYGCEESEARALLAQVKLAEGLSCIVAWLVDLTKEERA